MSDAGPLGRDYQEGRHQYANHLRLNIHMPASLCLSFSLFASSILSSLFASSFLLLICLCAVRLRSVSTDAFAYSHSSFIPFRVGVPSLWHRAYGR